MEKLQPSVGTTLKFNVNIEVEGFTMDEYDFICEFYIKSTDVVVKKKSEMIRVDSNNYLASFDSTKIGLGAVMVKITAFIPDVECEDNFRKEVIRIPCNVTIIS